MMKKVIHYIFVSLILSGLLAALDLFLRVVIWRSLDFNVPIVWDFFSRSLTVIFVFILLTSILPALISFLVAKKKDRGNIVSAVSLGCAISLYVLILSVVPYNLEFVKNISSFSGIALNTGLVLIILFLCFGAILLLYSFFKRYISKISKSGNIVIGCIVALVSVLTIIGYFAYDYFPSYSGSASINRPNVIIISIDTLRRDHVSVYSDRYVETPNIDEFASKSRVYSNAYTNSPWTMPSLYTMLSSRYPSVHGVGEYSSGNPSVMMLAEILAENGYDTEAIVANPLVREDFGFGKGFYRYNRFDETIPFGAFGTVSLCRSISEIAVHIDRPSCEGDATPWVTNMLISNLVRDRKRPFFIWAHYMDPHWPYYTPDEFIEDRTSYLSSLPDAELELMLNEHRRLPKSEKTLGLYYKAETRYVDNALRGIFDVFKQKGYYENTLIILTADHGEEIFEHGKFGHAITHYEEVMDIPLIIYVPGKKGGATETPVALIDVLPTILAYVGIGTGEQLSGVNILGGIDAETERDIFFDGILGDRSIISLRRGDYTLTRYGTNEYEYKLTDNRATVPEDDVTDMYPEIVDSFKGDLSHWHIELSEEVDEIGDHRVLKEDKSQKDNLKGLGYLN